MLHRKKRGKNIYKIINYPEKGKEYGKFLGSSPGQAAHKVMNFFKISDETEKNMAKFWLREYTEIDEDFEEHIKEIKNKIKVLINEKLEDLFLLLILNLLLKKKVIKKDFTKKSIKAIKKIFKKLNEIERLNAIALVLINYYYSKRKEKSEIENVIEINLESLNKNINQSENLNYIVKKKKFKKENIINI